MIKEQHITHRAFGGIEYGDGKYKLELLDDDREVVSTHEIDNAIVGYWALYNKAMNDYYAVCQRPTRIQSLVPAVIGLYSDATPVVPEAQSRNLDGLLGYIDLTSENPFPSDPVEGFRVFTEFKAEQVTDNSIKYTYVGEFPTTAANGSIQKLRMFGAGEAYAWASGWRSSSKNTYGIKAEYVDSSHTLYPMNGASLSTEGFLSSEGYTTKFPGFLHTSVPNGSHYGRIRTAFCAANLTRWLVWDANSGINSPTVYIQPIIRNLLQSLVPNIASGREAEPIAVITLPEAPGGEYAYGSSEFNGDDLVVTTRVQNQIHVDYYTAATGYSHMRYTYDLPKPLSAGSYVVSVTTGIRDGMMVIMENTRYSGSSSGSRPECYKAYMTHVNLADMTLLVTQKEIDYHAISPGRTWETLSSYYFYSLHQVFYEPDNQSYICCMQTTSDYFITGCQGWFRFKDKPVLTDSYKDLIAIGGWTANTRSETNRTSSILSHRVGAAINNGEKQALKFLGVPAGPGFYFQEFNPEQYIYIPSANVVMVVDNSYDLMGYLPFFDMPSTLMSEALTGEIIKTSGNALRVTYQVTVTTT